MLLEGSVVGAANWSEVAQKVWSRGADWPLAAAVLESFGLRVEPVTRKTQSGQLPRGARAAVCHSPTGCALPWAGVSSSTS